MMAVPIARGSGKRGCGRSDIQWDCDSLGWKNLEANEIIKRVTSKVQPGSIVLFHNAAKNTPEYRDAAAGRLYLRPHFGDHSKRGIYH